ncbi:ABC transporter permease [Mycobacterium sp. BMJ-28]
MSTYLVGRFAQAIGVLWAAYTVTFVVLYFLPSDPISIMLRTEGESSGAVDQVRAQELRAQYGFDKPLIEQYFSRLWSAVRGDFGTSIQTGDAVSHSIAEAMPQTAQLAGAAIVIAVAVGAGLALLASFVDNPWLRQTLRAVPPLWASLPTFWIGLVLVQVFSFQLRLLPAIGNDGIANLILPAITLSIPTAALIAQVLSKALDEVSAQPYIDTAIAKGASRVRVHLGHMMRNAAIPTTTLVGVVFGHLFAGSVVTETVFSRVGVGRLTEQAVKAQDIPMVQGLVLLAAATFVVSSLVVDLIYPVLDPRVGRSAAHATTRREALA